MGLFDLFKSKKTNNTQNTRTSNTGNDNKKENQSAYADSNSVSPDERPYYQPDEYYIYYSYPGTDMARRVITFEERKKISY